MSKKTIGITMGDPAGCGPEITIKALATKEITDSCNPVVIGDANVFDAMLNILENKGVIPLGKFHINSISNVKDAAFEDGIINVYHMDLINMETFAPGKLSTNCGDAAFRCVTKAIELAINKEIDATVTNAINKEAINLAGHHYSGHTEIYADYTGTKSYAMLLAHGDFRVIHVSTHVSLREACDRVKKARVLECIKLADEFCRNIGIANPKIGVAGLNPHAGENGMFGYEETNEIIPAITEANNNGINAEGPLPPDTVFSKALGGMYDIVVAMYHDQGHIPLKVKGFVYDRKRNSWKAVEGVNITLGLPIIRVSVDHGTAFDNAWRGEANELSLVNAIEYAVIMSTASYCSRYSKIHS